MTNNTENKVDIENEEHNLLEDAWMAIGPQGMAAAAVAAVAIGSTNGWINALWAIVAVLGGACTWLLVMKLLMKDRPEGYQNYINR